MKIWRTQNSVFIARLSAALLSSCLAFAQSSSFLYSANGISNDVSGYRINSNTGVLTPVPGSPFLAGLIAHGITADPAGRFLYVANANANTVSAFAIASSTGSLVAIPGSPFTSGGTGPHACLVHPNGRFLYVENNDNISVFAINQTTGSLTAVSGSPFGGVSLNTPSFNLATDAAGHFLYAPNSHSGSISGFAINSSTGALSVVPGSPFSTSGQNTQWVTLSPDDKFIYASESSGGTITAFSLNQLSGSLTPISGSPFLVNRFAGRGMTIDPQGRFIYVSDDPFNNVTGFQRNATSGALTKFTGPSTAVGLNPAGMAVDPSGTFVYVANAGVINNISGLRIDQATGALTNVPGSPFASGQHPLSLSIVTPQVATKLGISFVSPIQGGNAGSVTMQIVGTGFQSGAIVKLTGVGTDIFGADTNVTNSSFLKTTFDLTGAAVGARTVVVTNPDSTSVSLSTAFSIEQGGQSRISVATIGRNQIRGGVDQTYYLAIQNSGTTDAVEVPVFLKVQTGVALKLLSSLAEIPTATDIGGLNDPTSYEVTVSDGTVAGLVVTVPARSTVSLPFSLKAPFDASVSLLESWTIPPFLANASALAVETDPQRVLACLTDIGVLALGGGSATAAQKLYLSALNTVVRSILIPSSSSKPVSFFQVINRSNQLASALGLATSQLPDPKIFAAASKTLQSFSALDDCSSVISTIWQSILLQLVASLDPNDKIGLPGNGAARWISGFIQAPYSIYFENQLTATAPAQSVTVSDTLNSNLDLNTLTLGGITFPNQFITPPSVPLSSAPFAVTVDLRPSTNLLVSINASLNTATRVLTWAFQSLDPATGQPPTDPLAGFLPPGGEGSVFFTVLPKPAIATGTTIQNTATIIFDVNPPINTPTWSNTIDNTVPTSHILPLTATQSGLSFLVQWTGTDIGAGFQDYTVYVSDNNNPFLPWLTNTSSTQAAYAGVAGHTYRFYSLARDLVGNVEGSKTSPEASTQIVLSASPQIVATRTFSRDPQNNVIVSLTLTNTGGALAQSTLVTTAKIGSVSATSIPAAPVNIAAGSSAVLTLVFPPSVGIPNTAATLTTGGTYVGGSFNFSSRITLP